MPLLLVAGAAIAAAAVAVYCSSFSGRFTFDDRPSIVENATIRHLGDLGSVLSPPSGGYTVSGRPLVNLSLAINYALGGMNVWGYHAFNLAIHIFAGLALFGIMRRTLENWSGLSKWHGLAFAVALIWTVHPLQTESVTYVIQRAESMMGMFYLLTLYCFIRYAEETQAGKSIWGWLSIGACLLGMASKEVMVSAPVMVFLYDRTFITGSFRETWRRRGRYYLGLALTWILLVYLLLHSGTRGHTAAGNFGDDISPEGYWLTQFHAIMRYLALAAWPTPLVFDYGTQAVPSLWSVFPSMVATGLLGVGALCALFSPSRTPGREVSGRQAIGFAGVWFFAILAPTSLVPVIVQVMAEHRMYLALAPAVAVAVVGGYRLFEQLLPKTGISGAPIRLYLPVCLAAAAGLGFATAERNRDYHAELTLWGKTAARCPGNPRAQYNFGLGLSKSGNLPAAIERYREALRLKPDYTEAHNNLGIALSEIGRWTESIPEYEEAARLDPGSARIRYNLGNAFLHTGELSDAIASYQEGRRLADDPNIELNLGIALARAGRVAEAAPAYARALKLDPDFAKALYYLGNALLQLGRPDEAIASYERYLRLKPDNPDACYRLATALVGAGRAQEAIAWYENALRLRSGFPEAQNDLAVALTQSGRVQEALPHYQEALRLAPNDPEIHNNLGYALAQVGRTAEARAQFEEALRLEPDYPEARANLARLPAPPQN
jgi:protein O-mannosyl-transferase